MLDRRQFIGGLGALGLMAGPAVTGRAAAQAPRDTLDGDGIAANGRVREGREERHPGRHDESSVHARG